MLYTVIAIPKSGVDQTILLHRESITSLEYGKDLCPDLGVVLTMTKITQTNGCVFYTKLTPDEILSLPEYQPQVKT